MMLESEITELRISGNANFKQKKPEFFVNFHTDKVTTMVGVPFKVKIIYFIRMLASSVPNSQGWIFAATKLPLKYFLSPRAVKLKSVVHLEQQIIFQ